MEPLVSVIVPVYNVIDYLPACIDSMLAQTYTNLQILLVDDGSADGSGEYCDRYRDLDTITVLHDRNGGPSAARNHGLEECKGEFVFFLDADDSLEKNAIARMVEAALQYDADIVDCKVRHVYPGEDSKNFVSQNPPAGIYNHMEAVSGILNYTLRPVPWGKLYKTSLWNSLRFPLGIRHEDESILPYVVDQCSRYVVIGDPLYCYLQRPESYMNSAFDKRRLVMIDIHQKRLEYFSAKYKGAFDGIILYQYFAALLLLVVKGAELEEFRSVKKEFHRVFRLVMRSRQVPVIRKMKALASRLLPGVTFRMFERRRYHKA